MCSPKGLECVDQITVDNSKCLKSCSGLIVTSYTFYDLHKNLEDLLPIIGRYNHYKKITKHPSGYNGKITIIRELFVQESYL